MSDPLPAKLNRCLWLVLALAVLARLAFNIEGCLADPTYWNPIVDCCEYDGLARTLVQGYDPWNGPLTRPPLYPYLLTAVYYVFGPSLIAVRLLQLIAGVATCWLTWRIGQQLFGPKIGLLAALIVALYGPLIFFESQLLRAGLTTLSLLVVVWAALRASEVSAERPAASWWRWALTGLALGLLALLRPDPAFFVLVALLVWMAVRAIRSPGRRGGWLLAAVAVVVGSVVPVIPTTVRNYRVSGEFIPIATLGGLNLYVGNNPNADQTVAIRPGSPWQRLLRVPLKTGARRPGELDRYFVDQTLSYIRAQPGHFLAHLGTKTRRCLNSREAPRNIDLYVYRDFSYLLRVLIWRVGSFGFPFGVLAPLAFVGMIVAIRFSPELRQRAHSVLLIGVVVAVCLAVTLFFNASRYRIVIVPVLAVFAAHGGWWLGSQVWRRNWSKFAWGAAGLVLSALVVNSPVRLATDGIDFRADLYSNLGGRLHVLNKLPTAEQAFRRALEYQPDSAEYLVYLADVLSRQRRSTEAVSALEAAIDRIDDDPDLLIVSARVLGDAGQLERAADLLERAVQQDPYYYNTWATLSDVRARQHRYGDAIDHLEKAIELKPRYKPQLYLSLVRHCLVLHRYDQAVNALERGCDQPAPPPELTDALAWLLATCPDTERRDPPRAVKLAQQAIQGWDPQYPKEQFLDTLAAAQAANGQFEQAIATAERAVSLARQANRTDLAAEINRRKTHYQAGQIWTDPQR